MTMQDNSIPFGAMGVYQAAFLTAAVTSFGGRGCAKR
jgi:hypothetical protein